MVMVLMALDHARDVFSPTAFTVDPTDLTRTTATLFITRWVTHFCAPVFVFLAGTSVFLSAQRGKSRGELARRLLTRGAWLIILEFTVVRFGIFFNLDYHFVMGAVIWAIGWSMIALAGFVFLPLSVVATIGLTIVVGHNLLDPLTPEKFGLAGWLWTILHEGGVLEPVSGYHFSVEYPLLPWIGVMACGYAFGKLLSDPAGQRGRLIALGISSCLLFVIVRATNAYGDSRPWAVQPSLLFNGFSFVNCQKYPPSLLFLLMTLGPAITLLGVLPRQLPGWLGPLVTFGRVPMFFYILHIYLLHIAAVAAYWLYYGSPDFSFASPIVRGDIAPAADQNVLGHNLPMAYAAWLAVVIVLYPACRWFAGLKQRHRSAWLSYL